MIEIIATALSIFLVAFVIRILTARNIGMTWDEGLYALGGMIALKNIATRNYSHKAWSFEFHPPVLMYFFGIAYATYTFIVTTLKHKQIPNFKLLYQEAIRLYSGSSSLLVVRLPSAIMGSLSCVLTYFICLDVFNNPVIGIVAALFLAITPMFIALSSLVMLESGVTFFYLLTILSFFRATEYFSIVYIIAAGILLGLTFGSKETGFLAPLAVAPWLLFSLAKAYTLGGLGLFTEELLFFILWLLLGALIFYIVWPLLWKHPITQLKRNLGSVTKMTSRRGAGYSFYSTNLLASTPFLLIILYLVGTIESVRLLWTGQMESLIFLSWAFLPLIVMSMPFVPKRGGASELTFILPPLSILAGLATFAISQNVAMLAHDVFGYIGTSFYGFQEGGILLALSCVFLGLVAFQSLKIYPYFVNYCSLAGRFLGKKMLPPGGWGEGMDKAVVYVDNNAPSNSIVWIYGPKSTAFYHSARVNLRDSSEGQPIFYERTKAGFDSLVDENVTDWKKGDLKFYFPYYYKGEHNELDISRLKKEKVSMIVVYHWFTYDPIITDLDPGNYRIICELRKKQIPAFTVKIKGLEACWVYKVKDLGEQEKG
ncbi:MAG: glycosyltransferase family 39 protein [Candidatus Bathyarchaeota archaeon]